MSPHPSAPDLTPLFNWNTKQVFLYLEADYTNAQGVSRVDLLFLISILICPLKKKIGVTKSDRDRDQTLVSFSVEYLFDLTLALLAIWHTNLMCCRTNSFFGRSKMRL